MTPEQFQTVLTVRVPRVLAQRVNRVYFDAVSQLHSAIIRATPVDTGYLRTSVAVTMADATPDALPPRDRNTKYPKPSGGLNVPRTALVPLTIGFRALYAPFVEDKVGMVKAAIASWPAILQTAVANASD